MTDLNAKAINLFTYLKQLVQVRTPVVRALSSYEDVIWLY